MTRDNGRKPDARLHARKQEIRDVIRRRIAVIPAEERDAAGRAVVPGFRSLNEWRAGADLLVFLSMSDEIPTEPLMAAARADRLRVWAPRVVGPDLQFYPYEQSGTAQITRHRLGMDEPLVGGTPWPGPNRDSGQSVKVSRGSIVVCPCRAVDTEGRRLGRGGGYYDRFLTRIRGRRSSSDDELTSRRRDAEGGPMVIAVALAFECQVIDDLPADTGDAPVDLVMTERRVVRPDPRFR